MAASQDTVRVEAPTERRNPATTDIDLMSTLDILYTINEQDQAIPTAVAAVLPDLAKAVDHAVTALRGGHRVHYVGAGTSGRLATLDAVELIPTFNVPDDWVVAHHAGGDRALRQAVENAEDDTRAAEVEMNSQVSAGDFVLGLAASGRTPYVLTALATAHNRGAATALVTANPEAPISPGVDTFIAVNTGPEAIAGSTRMKAGTAQKMLLTAFSTATMIKMGRTYSNLMVSMRATNAKLRGRTLRILVEATGMPFAACEEALEQSDGDMKVALVQLLSGANADQSAAALTAADGYVRKALTLLKT